MYSPWRAAPLPAYAETPCLHPLKNKGPLLDLFVAVVPAVSFARLVLFFAVPLIAFDDDCPANPLSMSSSPNAFYYDAAAAQRNAATAAAIEQARQQRAAVRAQSPVAPAASASDVFIIVDGAGGECPASPPAQPLPQSPLMAPPSPLMFAPPQHPAYAPQSPVMSGPFAPPPMSPYAAGYAPYVGAPAIVPAAAPYYAPAIAASAAAAAAHGADAARAAGVVAECRPDTKSSSCAWPWIILFIVLALLALLAWRYFAQHHQHYDHRRRDGMAPDAANVADAVPVPLGAPAGWTRLVDRTVPGRFSATRTVFLE